MKRENETAVMFVLKAFMLASNGLHEVAHFYQSSQFAVLHMTHLCLRSAFNKVKRELFNE